MRPHVATFAHRTGDCAEMVCSNSFRSDDDVMNAVGQLHWEMRAAGGLIMATADRAVFLLRDVAMAVAGVVIVARTGHAGEVIVGLAGAGALVLCAGGMGLRMARRGIPTGWDLAVQMSSLLPWAVWTAVGADQGVHLGLTLSWIPVICWLLARIVKQLRAIPAAQPAA